ncbi:MAG: hypothetical protein LBE38_06145 [Deltaproteobacteria bacterium]|nr:hypothetical protein [Deltaproteobacteria bacterium]
MTVDDYKNNTLRENLIREMDQLDNELAEKIKIVLNDNSIQNKLDCIVNLMDIHHLKIKHFIYESINKHFNIKK